MVPRDWLGTNCRTQFDSVLFLGSVCCSYSMWNIYALLLTPLMLLSYFYVTSHVCLYSDF